jgi:hypothetical protein
MTADEWCCANQGLSPKIFKEKPFWKSRMYQNKAFGNSAGLK